MSVSLDEFLDEIFHVGTPRHSGRYPWGSGENPNQRNKSFLNYVDDLKKKGLSETEIASGMGMTVTQLRAANTIARNAQKKADISQAMKLKATGMSNVAIGKEMGINESSVRALLNPAQMSRAQELETVSNMLRDNLDKKGYLDIGAGVENHLGISKEKLNTAVAMLEEQGYVVKNVQVDQLGTGNKTTVKVLAPEGTEYVDIVKNPEKIGSIAAYSEDGGQTFKVIQPPTNVDSKRVDVRYAEQGGAEMDGVIELRRGVDDLSLGAARYAQVRIAVDGSHYLKGMAMYADDLPPGVDIRFNTNKSSTGNKLDAMKGLKDDPDNPFGSIVRQREYIGADGKKKLSALNIVGTKDSASGEEGGWYQWSHTLSSQMLSKQSPSLAKEQLGLSFDIKKAEFDEIMSLTNPVIKRKLLEKFADGADSSAVHLKAAGLPRTRAHVILPINSLKDNEIYAPQYNNGEKVVLIRHPHGGTFEIPELTVNNNNRQAKSVMDRAKDAVGINHKVAERLSGADFDGDTVLVIPNNHGKIRTTSPLKELKNFDPKKQYPAYEGMPKMSAKAKGRQMGDVSNLITDMTIKGATQSEIARAVKHSMVVIDAEKHNLNYKQSAIDNDIKGLKKKYQGAANAGAATLISKAKSEERVGQRKLRSAKDGGPVDPKTGEKVWTYSNESYTVTKVSKTGKVTTKEVPKTIKSTKMAEAKDARTLSSGTPMEAVYAEHANKLKALGNAARKETLNYRPIPMSPSAKKVYASEVATLNHKLNVALKNAPLERQAQLLANALVKQKRSANPDLSKEDIKKLESMALQEMRNRTGAKKQQIVITPREWEAIQSGAVSTNQLEKIINNSDLDTLKSLAMPRTSVGLVPAKAARARSMYANGYTQAEIAETLGVSGTAINDILQ